MDRTFTKDQYLHVLEQAVEEAKDFNEKVTIFECHEAGNACLTWTFQRTFIKHMNTPENYTMKVVTTVTPPSWN